LRVNPGEGGFDRLSVREAAHPHIVYCSSVVVVHARFVKPVRDIRIKCCFWGPIESVARGRPDPLQWPAVLRVPWIGSNRSRSRRKSVSVADPPPRPPSVGLTTAWESEFTLLTSSHAERYDIFMPRTAVGQLREALRVRPDWLPALMSLASLEATEPDAPRDSGDAVRLASRADDLSGRRDPKILDVLAAVYAAAGRFEDASRTAEAAQALASAGSDPDLAAQIRARVSVYRSMSGAR